MRKLAVIYHVKLRSPEGYLIDEKLGDTKEAIALFIERAQEDAYKGCVIEEAVITQYAL